MTNDTDNLAPYAPAKSVLAVLRRFREAGGLPEPLIASALPAVGVPESMAPRTHAALRFLKLVDEGGNRTAAFERLKRATTDEYPEQLAEIVRAAYLAVFSIVNPAEHDDIALADAFRQYEPSAQRTKMIRLFRALCEEAGIISPARKRTVSTAPRSVVPRKSPEQAHDEAELKQFARAEAAALAPAYDNTLIAALVQQLPRDARWTAERREKWLQAMASTIDLLFSVTATEPHRGEAPEREPAGVDA